MTPLYQIVSRSGSTIVADPAAVEALGYAIQQGRQGGAHLRAELRGQPCFVGIYGPMWGGTSAEGSPILRYETQEAYDFYSR